MTRKSDNESAMAFNPLRLVRSEVITRLDFTDSSTLVSLGNIKSRKVVQFAAIDNKSPLESAGGKCSNKRLTHLGIVRSIWDIVILEQPVNSSILILSDKFNSIAAITSSVTILTILVKSLLTTSNKYLFWLSRTWLMFLHCDKTATMPLSSFNPLHLLEVSNVGEGRHKPDHI